MKTSVKPTKLPCAYHVAPNFAGLLQQRLIDYGSVWTMLDDYGYENFGKVSSLFPSEGRSIGGTVVDKNVH